VGDVVGDGVIILKHPNPARAKVGYYSGIVRLSDAIRDMGALLFLDISDNNIGISWYLNPKYEASPDEEHKYESTDGGEQDEEPAGGLGPIGVIAVANAIKDMRAISSANLLKNGISIDQARVLASILKDHPTLKSLCGNKGDETELDMSAKMSGAEDAIMLAPEITDNGALSSLDLSSCKLTRGTFHGRNGGMNPHEFDSNYDTDMSGVTALANAIKDMGAMTSLNLASNNLWAEGAKIVAEAIKVTKCTPAIILAPFSRPSDFSINCCCLLLSAGYEGPIEAIFER
jgi:hypothetical protein